MHINFKRFSFSFVLFFFFQLFSWGELAAQSFCRTTALPQPGVILPHLNLRPVSPSASLTTLPIALHLFTDQSGNGNGLTPAMFQETLDSANVYFNQVNLQAHLCVLDVYMDDQQVNPQFDIDPNLFDSLMVTGMLNIFVPNSVNGTTWGGISSVIGGPYTSSDYVLMMGQDYYPGIMIHEIGHFLGLFHTHDQSNFGVELVNGSNCQTAGDLICDTPADHGFAFTGVDSATCSWTNPGNVRDPLGDLYAPSPVNLMSYTNLYCLKEFTPMQLQVIRNSFDTHIAYFDTLCASLTYLAPATPSLSFSISPNPSSDHIRLSFEGAPSRLTGLLEVRITDAQGRSCFFRGSLAGEHDVDLSLEGLPAGMYVVDVPGLPEYAPVRMVRLR